MNLSPHFTLEEMVISETASRKGINNTPSAAVIENMRVLCGVLEEVRRLLGQPILITSGYRSAALNKAIGGSTTSAHQHGLAADFIAPPLTPLEVCLQIEASDIGFDQLIYEYTWTHFGLRKENMRRQTLTLNKAGGYIQGIKG